MLDDALGDLASHVDDHAVRRERVDRVADRHADVGLDGAGLVARWSQDSSLVPFLTVGATDARFFRRAGSVAYGFGLFSPRLSFEDFAAMFHGNDERVDVDSLVLSTQLWDALARDLLA